MRGPGTEALDTSYQAGPGGGSPGRRSASSSWRYTSVGDSADSDTYSGLLASVAAQEGGLVAAVTGATAANGGVADAAIPPAGGAAAGGPGDPASRQLWSPNKRPQLQAQPLYDTAGAVSGGGGVPAGMDAASYAAGERAALMCAFQQALPGQQALGQCFSGGRAGCTCGELGATSIAASLFSCSLLSCASHHIPPAGWRPLVSPAH